MITQKGHKYDIACILSSKFSIPKKKKMVTENPKDVFMKCGTCSQTFAHILNREFGHAEEEAEHAIDPLAGGIVNRGHQCGMLWGATLAVGKEAYHRNPNLEEAIATAVTATQHIVESFVNRTQTVNCREITGYNLNSVMGMVGFMIKTLSKGMKNSLCFNLADDWAPEAIQAGKEGLETDPIQLKHDPVSCASEVVRRMGGTEEEIAMVSGFAGGLGLSGHACGALSAAIWMKTLRWVRENPGKNPPMFNNKMAKQLIKGFENMTDSKMLCREITEREFESINDYSEFILAGGCERLIEMLSEE